MSRLPRHPNQPLVLIDGAAYFKSNAIVKYLLESNAIGLCELAMMPFSDEDHRQLAQLIGYSVSGYGELSYVPHKMALRMDAKEAKMLEGEG